MKRFDLVVLGIPVPHNPRAGTVPAIAKMKRGLQVTLRDCYPIPFVPSKVREWQKVIHYSAQRKVQETDFEMWKDTPLLVDVTFYLPRPKSLPKRVQYPIKKPDDDNLMRPLQNALQGVVYDTDSRIVTKLVRKRFHPEGKIGVTISIRVCDDD